MIICPWKDIKKYAALLPVIDEAFDAVNALTEYEDKKNYPLSDGNRGTRCALDERMLRELINVLGEGNVVVK